MDSRLISNQVFENIQVPTLEEEPKAKSTILYANRYSGISEVDLTDPELLSVINSTVGVSGNNVLVQLKNKMATFRNGPWYIDSRNGVIYIHNRKHPEDSVYQYIYQHENGEVLSASFRMVEVNSPIAGLGGFVSAVSKAIGMLQAEIGKEKLDAPSKELPESWDQVLGGRYIPEVPFSTRVSDDNNFRAKAKVQVEQIRKKKREQEEESKREFRKYNATSNKEKFTKQNEAYLFNYDRANESELFNEFTRADLKRGNPLLKSAYYNWVEMVKIFGPNSPQAKQAKAELLRESRKAKTVIPSKDHWSMWTKTLTTKEILGGHIIFNKPSGDIIPKGYGQQPPSPFDIEAAIQERIRSYTASCNIKNITNITRVGTGEPKYIGMTKKYGLLKDTYHSKWTVTFTIKFFGYGSGTREMNAERLIRGMTDRYSKSNGGRGVPDAAGMIRNAAANIGRGKKEKKLQASIRVVGNPILETGQQIDIQNVGKKHSGKWYIHQITHSLEHGQGYVTDMVLSRQSAKASASGTYSEIHTQSYTVDNEPTDPKSIKSSGRGTTSTKIRGKANVVQGNREFSYQDAANIPWTLEERLFAKSIAHNEQALIDFTYMVTDKNYSNKVYGTKYNVVSMSRGKIGKEGEEANATAYLTPPRLFKKDIPREQIKSNNFDVVRNSANKRKGKK